MFMHKSKKGFTIVELVIVIAVIAILAAVLIPTFSNLVKKANIANDTALAKNINTALTAYKATNAGDMEFEDVIAAARDAGYIISNLNPTTAGHYFVWEKSTNQILLVDGENAYKVIYANNEKYAPIGASWYFATSDKAAATALKADTAINGAQVKDMVGNIAGLNAAIAAGGEVYLDESVVLDKDNLLVIDDANANVTIEMGSAALNTSGILAADGENVVPVSVKQGTVTVNGGVIAAAGAGVNFHNLPIKVAVKTEKGTNVTFNGTEFNNGTTAAQIRIAGTATMKDVAITSSRIGVDTLDGANLVLENTNISVSNAGVANYRGSCVISCSFNGTDHTGANNSLVTIKSGTYTTDGLGDRGNLSCCDGNINVEGGTFNAPAGKMFYISNGGTITITGGTFNGKSFADLVKGGANAWNAYCDTSCHATVSADGKTVTISK